MYILNSLNAMHIVHLLQEIGKQISFGLFLGRVGVFFGGDTNIPNICTVFVAFIVTDPILYTKIPQEFVINVYSTHSRVKVCMRQVTREINKKNKLICQFLMK